jgi:hypothetical protein
MQENLEALLREVEISSMAKVWAYPDDLAAIIQGIRGQEQQHGTRLVSAQDAVSTWLVVGGG